MPGAPSTRDVRGLLVRMFEDAVLAVRPDRLVADGGWMRACTRRLEAYGRVLVVAVGKGAIPFASAMEASLGDRLSTGVAVVPYGYARALPGDLAPPGRVRVLEAGHPVPDSAGLDASREVLSLVRGAEADDLVIACISGGASALLPAPSPGISLTEVARLTRSLLGCGAPIDEVNTVRRALSQIAGGGLARAAAPAEVVGLVLSDVPGDDPAVVAGGPVSTAPTSAGDALDVLDRFGVETPAGVVSYLRQSRTSAEVLATVRVIGSNADLLRAAAESARRGGLDAMVHEGFLTGEARSCGARVIREALGAPSIHVFGGETTVRVTGGGTGGRSQELALSAAIELDATGGSSVLLAAGSDGVDGPTAVAGALCDRLTLPAGRRLGLDAGQCLDQNDSWNYFNMVGGHVVTGPTHTNVMDLVVVAQGVGG